MFTFFLLASNHVYESCCSYLYDGRYTIDADPVTGSTGFVTVNLNDFTHKKYVDRVYFYSIVALGAFNTTTSMVTSILIM